MTKRTSRIRGLALRMKPHEDVKKNILEFAKQHGISAGCILSAVGSLEQLSIRFANRSSHTIRKAYFEVVSLTGTFSASSLHIHLLASDRNGKTIGGHLLEGNLVYTTLEIAVAELNDLEFHREKDPTYGYSELKVKSRSREK